MYLELVPDYDPTHLNTMSMSGMHGGTQTRDRFLYYKTVLCLLVRNVTVGPRQRTKKTAYSLPRTRLLPMCTLTHTDRTTYVLRKQIPTVMTSFYSNTVGIYLTTLFGTNLIPHSLKIFSATSWPDPSPRHHAASSAPRPRPCWRTDPGIPRGTLPCRPALAV